MARMLWFLAAVAGAAVGCGGNVNGGRDGAVTDGDASLIDAPIDSPNDPPIDAPPIDAPPPVDAAIDASGCGTDLRLVGEYIDWDSNNAGFMGIGGASWSVIGEPSRTTQSMVNGTVIMCLNPGAPSQIAVSGPGTYLPALFLADPAVFSPPGSRFEARGLQSAVATAQYMEFMTDPYSSGRSHVLVYKIGQPIPLALDPVLNPPQRSFVSDGPNDISWTDGAIGTFTLFPNRPFGDGTATLTSTSPFVGPTTIPIAQNRFTIVVIR